MPVAGLVVATMGDMGTSSVESLKQLGVSEKAHSFRFHDQETVALFDPHLLKWWSAGL
jgi:hypothetical protein